MSVPKYNEMYAPFLKALADGKVHTIIEVRQFIAERMGMTEADLSEMLPSGKQGLFANRLGWTRQYLKKADLIVGAGRGQIVLTSDGKKAVLDADIIDNKYLQKYPSFRAFMSSQSGQVSSSRGEENTAADVSEKSPEESLEYAYAELNASLADDLMAEINGWLSASGYTRRPAIRDGGLHGFPEQID